MEIWIRSLIGLIYMLIKRAVDKYNLVFVYDTEIADKSVHRLAGNFIIIALIIQQLTLLFFVLVRSGNSPAILIIDTRWISSRKTDISINDIIGEFYSHEWVWIGQDEKWVVDCFRRCLFWIFVFWLLWTMEFKKIFISNECFTRGQHLFSPTYDKIQIVKRTV